MRTQIVVVSALLLVTGSGAVAAANRTSMPAGCAAALAWVQQHGSRLPKTLDEFQFFPSVYQRAVFRSLEPAGRIELWRQHLRRYTGAGSRLTVSQRSFIDSVASGLDEFMNDPAVLERLPAFAATAQQVLGVHPAQVVFGRLGLVDTTLVRPSWIAGAPHDPSSVGYIKAAWRIEPSAMVTIVASRYLPAGWVRSTLPGAGNTLACGCHSGSNGDFCDSGTGPAQKCQGAENCGDMGTGCGWLWLQSCNGQCVLINDA